MDVHDQQILLIMLEQVNQERLTAKEKCATTSDPGLRTYYSGQIDACADCYGLVYHALQLVGVEVPQD